MDEIDLRILDLLSADGRMTFADLAEQVGLSAPSTAERVRRLELRGVIRGYVARLDPTVLGVALTAFVSVTLTGPDVRDGFLTAVGSFSEVVECHHVAGDDDYVLKVHVDGTHGLEHFVSDRLKAVPGIARTRTTVVLSTSLDRPLAPAPR
jgi:Lrp/AsnC family transcriptional regulator, leucine-responsive regulatory protein